MRISGWGWSSAQLALHILIFSINVQQYAVSAFRVLEPGARTPNGTYFQPFDMGFVGRYGEATNFQRERINEGAYETSDQELLFEGVSPRQSCPGMVGPFSDGSFYCTAREFGYCDRRSGTCFCNTGYAGIDCTECQDSHFRIGTHCYPKRWCPNDCSGAGVCNFNNGTCTCLPHRTGLECEQLLCTIHSPLCEACTDEQCLKCQSGYYLTLGEDVCSTCFDFDPRCAGCTKEEGCTTCADSTLTSVRRSGFRASDPALPTEEITREFGITIPFGSKSPESFADSENYVVVTTPENPLRNSSISCAQGLMNDESWSCERFPTSHIVCGHFGVFSFVYPNYAISERTRNIRMSVRRTGGGFGNVFINYFIKHFTTNDSDLIATAAYTTSQRLSFEDGVVERSFLITILNDNIVEEDEVFQVVLEVPEGGGSVGAQFRTNVTIIDDDSQLLSPKLTKSYENTTRVRAGDVFTTSVIATAANGQRMTMGGDRFFAVIENDVSQWSSPGTASGSQRNAKRQPCPVIDAGNGSYIVNCGGVQEQGIYQLRVWHCFPRAIQGEYYNDGFFERLAVRRWDHMVNYTWGAGRLIPRGADYISIRWSGVLLANHTGMYQFKVEADDHARLWVDGKMLLDHWHEQSVNLEPSRDVYLQGGFLYEVVMEYREVRGEAYAQLLWGFEGGTLGVVPQENLFALFEIDRSPVVVTVYAAETAANLTECTGAGLFEATALIPAFFSVCPRDRFGNLRDDDDLFYLMTDLISADLTILDDLDHGGVGAESLVPTFSYNAATHCFDGTYTAELAGDYELRISFETARGEGSEEVSGSPFFITVEPDRMSGPKSLVLDLDKPLYAEAGYCYNFTVVARDNAENYLFHGGDNLQAYMFRVDFSMRTDGTPMPTDTGCAPSSQPTSTPSASPTALLDQSTFTESPASDTGFDVVREGLVIDSGNGNYTVQLCPVIAGVHEIHVLRDGSGVSNQPVKLLSRWNSREEALGRGTFTGQYVSAGSPYKVVVSHSVASGMTTTAGGAGLIAAVVGVPVSFMITVRDAWENVLRTPTPSVKVTASLDRSPTATVNIFDYDNGSYNIEYTPVLSGDNLISVLVDGFPIRNSPFIVPTEDGATSSTFSFAQGAGLITGRTGDASYFEVFSFDGDGNRKADFSDVFYFTVEGSSTVIVGYTLPCPSPPISGHPICSEDDELAGHYFGTFTPLATGEVTISVFLETQEVATAGDDDDASIADSACFNDTSSSDTVNATTVTVRRLQVFNETSNSSTAVNATVVNATDASGASDDESDDIVTIITTRTQLFNSPFVALISPSAPTAENSDISGALYDNVAGVSATVTLALRDDFGNLLQSGGKDLELALLGVAVDWGTVQPLPENQGLPNEHFYRGFYAGYPNFYGSLTDHLDGRYTFDYNVPTAGKYVLRLSLAEEGLNATYFNSTDFGYLVDGDDNYNAFVLAQQGLPRNLGSSISWTGDLGGLPGVRGGIGESTYYYRYATRTESQVLVDFRSIDADDYFSIDRSSSSSTQLPFKFRDEYWSARWTGMITPQYAEQYKFSAEIDDDSTLLVRIGGRGLEFNNSQPGEILLQRDRSNSVVPTAWFNFTELQHLEFLVEFAHFTGDAVLLLYWESLSTPRSLIPATAFTHWRNASHFNTTIAPAPLCSSCSTAVGAALSEARVAVQKSFLIYARDEFGNLLQRGGDVPTAVAVGSNGASFRGIVTDYGNSTYLVQYYPSEAGRFLLYITIGCCTPHPDVGYPAEMQQFKHLLIKGAPFLLTVAPAPLNQSTTVAAGQGLSGGIVGFPLSFTTFYRDIHDNPTAVDNASESRLIARFIDTVTGSEVKPAEIETSLTTGNATTTYSITTAGSYLLHVFVKAGVNDTGTAVATQEIKYSPFAVRMIPNEAAAGNTVCRGVGLRQASLNMTASMEIQLFDRFRNNLIIGGDFFWIRLQGDANFSDPLLRVIPRCEDTHNGRYICRYQPLYAGPHQLSILHLNSSVDPHGGEGLTASYYASYDGAADARSGAQFRRIDAQVKFSWPGGLLVPVSELPVTTIIASSSTSGSDVDDAADGVVRSGELPLRSAGQSVRWEGFLVAPRSDIYTFSALLQRMEAVVYLDDRLVFDSAAGVANAVSLLLGAAYEIRVLARTNYTLPPAVNVFSSAVADAMSIDLRWSTPTVNEYSIPQYFLYDSAEEIAFSPFPVNVQ